MEAKVSIKGHELIIVERTIIPGGIIDLGSDGLIVWLKEPEAEAARTFIRQQQRRVREAIENVKRRN